MLDKIQPNVDLPNEILGIIFNDLASVTDANDNRAIVAALTSCRLACHVLCSFATPLLFSSIELTESRQWVGMNKVGAFREGATNLNQILTNNINIATSVQTLKLRCYPESFKDVENGNLIAAILSRLPHIRNFALEGCFEQSLEFSIATKRDLGLSIQTLCRSPNLTTLSLHNIACFPITHITKCPNLRYLRLSWTTVNPIFFIYIPRQLTVYSSLTSRMRHQARSFSI